MHTFVSGPSGSGKSCLSQRLAEKDDTLLIECDVWPVRDIVVELGFRDAWDSFYKLYDPMPLKRELDRRSAAAGKSAVVMSLPGYPILDKRHVEAARNIFRIIYFIASPEQCLESFLERERQTGRGLTASHWAESANVFFAFLAAGDVSKNSISVFSAGGTRKSFEQIYDEMQKIR